MVGRGISAIQSLARFAACAQGSLCRCRLATWRSCRRAGGPGGGIVCHSSMLLIRAFASPGASPASRRNGTQQLRQTLKDAAAGEDPGDLAAAVHAALGQKLSATFLECFKRLVKVPPAEPSQFERAFATEASASSTQTAGSAAPAPHNWRS